MPEQPTLEQVFLALRERLEYHERTGDVTAVLDSAAGAQAEALRDFAVYLPESGEWPPLVVDWNITHLLAQWHYARSELDAAAFLFALVNQVAPHAVPEPLRERVSAEPAPEVADLAGLFAQSIDAFARWEATGDADAIGVAIRLASWSAAGTPDGHPDKPMILSNLCASMRTRFAVRGDPADLEEAIATGRRAVELAPADHPELALIANNYGFAMQGRFSQTGSAQDLDTAIDLARQAVRAMPADNPNRALFLSNLGLALVVRFERRDDIRDINEGVDRLRDAIREVPVTHRPQRANFLTNLALALYARFGRLGDPADLDAAVVEATDAIRVGPQDHPHAARCLANLSRVLTARFERSADPADADAAVEAARRAAEATPDGHLLRADHLDLLGRTLRRRGERQHDRADLAEAVRVHEQAAFEVRHGPLEHTGYLVSLCDTRLSLFNLTDRLADADAAVEAGRQAMRDGAGEPRLFVALIALGSALQARAKRTGSPNDLDEAIELFEQARHLTPDGDPALVKCLSELGSAHVMRFQRTSDLADLDRGVAATERAVELAPPHDPQRVIDVSNVAGVFGVRFGRSGDLADLHAAIDWGREAVRVTPEDHKNRAGAEFHLGRAMQSRFERSGSLADLDEAIRQLERAERRVQSDPAHHAMMLSNLGAALRIRYERLDRQADGDRAVELSRRAVEVIAADDPDRAIYLSNLTTALVVRCNRTGAPRDVEAAVDAGREAVRLTPEARFERAASLNNLAYALHKRYEQTLALADLDEAIEANREASRLMPADHPLRPQAVSNLSNALMSRFERAAEAADLDEMIETARSAVEAVPTDHAVRPRYLSNYANALHLRHALTADPRDAEAGVAASREAVRATPDNHPNRMVFLGNLAATLEDRHAHTQLPADLDAVIEAARAAVQVAPDGHPGRSLQEYNLGRALVIRATRTGSPTDWDTATGLFRDAARTATAATSLRIQCARAWAEAAGEQQDWAEAVAGYTTAIELLPLLAWHGLERGDRVSALGRVAGLASSAAATAFMLDDPGQALRLLEQGRGVLLAQALDARDDLSELATADPELAERMRVVRAELDSAGTSAVLDEDVERTQRALTERRREVAREWDSLLARARALPGMADFLRLPPLERLRAAAVDGPVVVVNANPLRCDALIVTADGLNTVPLPGLDAEGLLEHATTLLEALVNAGKSVADRWRAQRVLNQVLRWLWDTVAEPVLDALPSDPARLWWCPTGLLTFLPVHAAGHHGSGSRRTLLDRVVCSYTPTLRALAEARGRPAAPGRMLAVGQPATPGLSPLPQALTEVRRLASRMPGTTLLAGDAATREAVLTALPEHSYVHFAGHGGQNPLDAGGGALYCDDHRQAGPITVADIAGLRLDRAELVFLSACETARGAIALPDEAVHMAGALQLAGFTHVVATQWVVSDTHAADVADHFYAGLTDGSAGHAAAALHAAVRRLRDQHADPLLWASYLHTGP